MTRSALPIIVAGLLAGCSAASASASPYDSANPVHCMTIFGAGSGAARNGPVADELNARILFIVRANGGADWVRKITPVSVELGKAWEAAPDKSGIMTLFDECRSRQDADPKFQAALPELIREGRRISASAL